MNMLQVEKMVKEAERFAKYDKKKRDAIETKMKKKKQLGAAGPSTPGGEGLSSNKGGDYVIDVKQGQTVSITVNLKTLKLKIFSKK